MRHVALLGTAWVVLLAAGCAGAPKPTDQLVRTEAALRASEEVGVSHVPQAQLHQTLAQEQLAKARKLMAEGENELAKAALDRAKADAELALALAREQEAQEAARAAAKSNAAEPTPASPAMHVQGTRSN